MWHCLSVFSWFFPMLHWIDCDIVYLCSYGSSSCCIGLIVTLFICVLMVLLHVALNWLWYCYSVFSCFFLMLPWIDCDIVLSVFSWFFVMMLLIYCNIVHLCSHGSSSCCIELIVTLFICVLMGLPRVALNWLWHCLSLFLWVFLMLHWIDCDIVYLCSYGSPSCCIELIVILLFCVFMVLPHVALDWLWYRFFCVFMVFRHDAFDLLWHCLSLFSWFVLMLHWIDCDIGYLCSYGSSLCCIGLIVTLFICVPIGLPHVALNWLWHWFSVFSWFFLMSHWIDCGIVYLCSYGSSSCCIGLIVALFICFLMVLPHVALDWLWHCLTCVLMVLPYVALDRFWHCLSVLSWFFLMLH